MRKKKLRKRVWVSRRFQWVLTLRLLAVLLFLVLLTGSFFYLAIGSSLRQEFSEANFQAKLKVLAKLKLLEETERIEKPGFDPSIFESPELLREYEHKLHSKLASRAGFYLVLLLSISIPLIAILSLQWSHRVVGSIARIREAIRKLREGDLTVEIRLRKTDELQDLAEDISYVARQMRERVTLLKEKLVRLRRIRDNFEGPLRDPERDLLAKEVNLRNLSRELEELSSAFEEFKTRFSS